MIHSELTNVGFFNLYNPNMLFCFSWSGCFSLLIVDLPAKNISLTLQDPDQSVFSGFNLQSNSSYVSCSCWSPTQSPEELLARYVSAKYGYVTFVQCYVAGIVFVAQSQLKRTKKKCFL